MKQPEQILGELDKIVRKTFPDRDFPEEVGTEMKLFADLGMASIDLIVLAERLEAYYGRKIAFGGFLKGLRDRQADDIEIGDLVSFLQQSVR